MDSFIIKEKKGNIGIVTLNRPEKINAWDIKMRSDFYEVLSELNSDEKIYSLIITGAGKGGFCAGQDLSEASHFETENTDDWIDGFYNLYSLILSIRKPIVAALNGVAAGSGFQLALLADLRIGHSGVIMGQPEINSGIASITGPWIMKEILGLSRTIDLTLTGRMMPAEECFRIGIINRLVSRERVFDEALSLAAELGSKSPTTMRVIKQRVEEVLKPGMDEAFAAAKRLHRETFAAGDPQRGIKKFLAR